jgi:glutathione synthase/RimK-type ligase-like ATP-grasp enzyme
MKVHDHHVMDDVKSILSLDKHYVSVEPFINGAYDLRIQKIGNHFRAFKRIGMSGNWKTNTGSSILDEIPVLPKYQFWIDQVSQLFGGLDICTVDAIHDIDADQDIIMEVNGCSSGLSPDPDTMLVDIGHIKELVISKMNSLGL